MATRDGYEPYATGMTAEHAVRALWMANSLPETLKSYSRIVKQETAPLYKDVYNDCSYWYNIKTNKLYRAIRNDTYKILAWFEV